MQPLLETRNVEVVYGESSNRVFALRGIDLSVSAGEFLAIMGPSGSGKSTLLHVLGGVVRPTGGHVLIDGEDLAAMDDDRRTLIRRKRLGFIFQSFNLLPTLTAEENAALPLVLDGISRHESRSRAADAIDRVGMSHRRTRLPAQLSGGEQQRVAIARAMAIEPAILLADEPTGNLDSTSGRQIADLLQSLVDGLGKTLVLVTHDADIAARAGRILRLSDGRIVEDGPNHARPRDVETPAS